MAISQKAETPMQRMKRLRTEVAEFIEGQLIQEFVRPAGSAAGTEVQRFGSNLLLKFPGKHGPDYIEIIVKGMI